MQKPEDRIKYHALRTAFSVVSRLSQFRNLLSFASFRLFLFCLLITVNCQLITSCGYHNPYVDETTNIPVSIHIPMWENQTNIAGLEYTFLEKMHSWFRKNSTISTTSSAEQADLALQGSIAAINIPGLSYGLYERITEGEVQLTVSFSLSSKDEKIWNEPSLVLEEAYFIAPTAEETRSNLNKALARMAEDLAEKIYLKTLTSQLDK